MTEMGIESPIIKVLLMLLKKAYRTNIASTAPISKLSLTSAIVFFINLRNQKLLSGEYHRVTYC